MQYDYLTLLLGIQGFRVVAVKQVAGNNGGSVVRMTLERTREWYICGGCGQVVFGGVDHTWQELHHLTL